MISDSMLCCGAVYSLWCVEMCCVVRVWLVTLCCDVVCSLRCVEMCCVVRV